MAALVWLDPRHRAGVAVSEGLAMKAYRILVQDSRMGGVVELAAEMRGDARALEFARNRLASSDHVDAVEVWSGPVRLGSYRSQPALQAA
jgi:hypothetical protein